MVDGWKSDNYCHDQAGELEVYDTLHWLGLIEADGMKVMRYQNRGDITLILTEPAASSHFTVCIWLETMPLHRPFSHLLTAWKTSAE